MSESRAIAAGPATGAERALPAQRVASDGRVRIDYRAIAGLAFPLMVNSSLQAVINLTDTWFVGHISTTAMAGMAAIFWMIFFFVMLVGGIGLGVQTFVAQYEGSGRRWRAGHATWVGLWGAVATFPLFLLLGWQGGALLQPFGLDPAVEAHALEFWWPRMIGAPLGVALWGILGFFNGIARPRVTLVTTGIVATVNAALNYLFIFRLDWGIAGSAWATNASMLVGLLFALGVFLRRDLRRVYRTHLTWRPDAANLWREFKLGLPMGAMYAADLFGMALFALMQVRLGEVDGATTQIVVMLTSIAYLPGVDLALAGTTLVGQAIGAGDRAWARRLGNSVITVTAGYMGAVGVLLAALGPWVLPLFVGAGDPQGAEVTRLGLTLLWIAAGYQLFDGIQLGSGFALRGAGDVRVPALIFLGLSWGVFVPLAHVLTFTPGQGWTDRLPQFGLGAVGGWLALLVYVLLLGGALFLRWRSNGWQNIQL
jgi:multidrug resistance protein, MATE family